MLDIQRDAYGQMTTIHIRSARSRAGTRMVNHQCLGKALVVKFEKPSEHHPQLRNGTSSCAHTRAERGTSHDADQKLQALFRKRKVKHP